MSVKARLQKIEDVARKRFDNRCPKGYPNIIAWLQANKVSVGLWPFIIRVYAANYEIPVYGKLLDKDQHSVTDELRRFYLMFHRLPWERVETDHPERFGAWEKLKAESPDLVSDAHAKMVFGDESTYPPKMRRELEAKRKRELQS